MKKLTYVNPYTWESERVRASTKVKRRTTKGRNKRCPPGMIAMDRTINKMEKLHKGWEEESREREAKFRLGSKLSERDVTLKPFTEQPFGTLYSPDSCGGLCGLSQEVASHLSSNVVAIALFDGDVMIYACSGIALPYRTIYIERFITSSRLVEVFNERRNIEDNLNIKVRGPSKETFSGFLELYDQEIAIVMSPQSWRVSPVDLDPQGRDFHNTCRPAATKIVAAGRSYEFCGLMATNGTLTSELKSMISGCCITEAALGGPIVDLDGNFLGMNICCGSGNTCFMPRHSIFQRVYKFRLLDPIDMQEGNCSWKECMNGPTPHGAGSSTEETETSSQVYSMPPGAKKIKPSGFLRKLDVLTRLGYPDPPPLMLELNGELVNKFEEDFGYLHAWSGYPYNLDSSGAGMNAWARFDAKRITTISRRVVSLSSYNEGIRFFACTGLLIKCRANRETGCRRTVILTSASLFRTCDKPDKIDENLRIEVFLPPKQRAVGILESYDSHHNIAIGASLMKDCYVPLLAN